jgi:hypothetical protein
LVAAVLETYKEKLIVSRTRGGNEDRAPQSDREEAWRRMLDDARIEDAFVEVMMNETLTKLDGTHPAMARFEYDDWPSKVILLGTLAPPEPGRLTRTSALDNSICISFLVPRTEKLQLSIRVRLAVFYRVSPSLDEQRNQVDQPGSDDDEQVPLKSIWKRRHIELGPLGIVAVPDGETVDLDLTSLSKQVTDDPEGLPRRAKLPKSALKSTESFRRSLDEFRRGAARRPRFDWKAHLEATLDEFTQDGQNLTMVKVSLVNDTKPDNLFEDFLFDAGLSIDTNGLDIVPFSFTVEYENFPRRYTTLVRSKNCHAEVDTGNRAIDSRHWALSQQPRLQPRTSVTTEETYALRFDDQDFLSRLETLVHSMEARADHYDRLGQLDGKAEFDRKRFHDNTKRVREGLSLLKTGDPKIASSFRLMQEVFAKASTYPGWRLFQIAFILAILPDIIDRSRGRTDTELLHVYTGGGKSEAYFGAVVLAMFHDRLSGKTHGVTAITKFPLRMLSVQQLQRIARVVAHAEEIRRMHSVAGEPFSVGYFVGSSAEFPRYCTEIKKEIEQRGPLPGKIIQECPLCGAAVRLIVDTQRESTAHQCAACERVFYLYFTGEEVYRWLPSFIVCTVDKLAGVATNRRFRNLFGGKLSECPKGHGSVPSGDKCEASVRGQRCDLKGVNTSHSPTAPTLVIQDELHLVREGFGGINAHFETLLSTLQMELAGYVPKRIAMTATVAGAAEQVRQLYVEDLKVFPGDSPLGPGNDDFFFELMKRGQQPDVQRRIIGLRPNNRDNQFAALLTIRHLAQFIGECETDPVALSERLGTTAEHLRSILSFYKTLLTYHNKKSDVHSISYFLEAVVNSQLSGMQVEPLTLTGDNTLDEIREAIGKIEKFGTQPNDLGKLLSVFATSVVSHGVDLDRLNIMLFQGIPKSTSEYIQALSRSGRSHRGVVFVWFYPNRIRDISFYESFLDYHELLSQMVEKVPLSRWTELVFMETFTSLFSAAILNYFSEIAGVPLYAVEAVNRFFANPNNRSALIQFLGKSLRVSEGVVGADQIRQQIPMEVEQRLNFLSLYTGKERHFFPNALREHKDRYFRTQFGMRGIQELVPLGTVQQELAFEKRYRG